MLDAHHILHNKQEWSLRPEANQLRTNRLLIPLIDREVHNELHRACPAVPLLGFHALRRIARDFEQDFDTIGTVDNLLLSMEKANTDPRNHAIERSLGELAIEAIDLQRPFLIEGMPRTKRVIY